MPATLTGTGGNATIDTGAFAVSLSGPLSGPGGLIKTGNGVLTLSGSNGYTGNTTVSAGKLAVNGSLAHSPANVSGGASLGGSGSIGGVTTVAGGSTSNTQGAIDLTDGMIDTLTFSDIYAADTVLTLGGSTAGNPSALNFDLGPSADNIQITAGKLAVNPGGGVINITALSGIHTGVYDLIDFPIGHASGLTWLSLGTTTLPGGYQLSLQTTPTAEQLVVSSVPEPSTFALLVVGAVGLAACGWRRRRRCA
jgi:autotransporter-associated beta strand protein